MYETDFPEYGQQCELVTPWRGYHRGTIVGRTAKKSTEPGRGLVEKRDCPDDGAGVGFADAGRKTGWRSRKATRGLTRGWYVSSNRRVVETLEGILLPFIICRNPECPEGTCTNDWHSPFGSNSVACRWKR